MEAKSVAVHLKKMNVQKLRFTIEGTSPLIQHAWAKKNIDMLRDKGLGKKTKERTARNAEAEAEACLYKTNKGEPGINLLALKSAIIGAAHKDIGIEKTLVRKGFFIKAPDSTLVLPMKASKPLIREDAVRVGNGAADLRYRPQFNTWSVEFDVEYDADLLQPTDIANLIDRAGFGVGIGEWRPEKNGEFGRFRVKSSA